jgi:hypothetical protein
MGFSSAYGYSNLGIVSYGVATGGTPSSITVGGINYTLLTFESDANLVVSTGGLFDVFLIGGGGGSWNNAGGSGPGGIARSTINLPAGTHAVDVGAGGAGNTVGLSSTIGATTLGAHVAPVAVGGGFGPMPLTGCGAQPINSGVVGIIPSQNPFAGGNSLSNAGGGGAGGGGVGGNALTANNGGAGGPGFDVSVFIGGSALLKCGGGGGGGSSTGGAGGTGGGGAGGSGAGNPGAGVANSGGGAGGIYLGTPQAGGSGIVYVRFRV